MSLFIQVTGSGREFSKNKARLPDYAVAKDYCACFGAEWITWIISQLINNYPADMRLN